MTPGGYMNDEDCKRRYGMTLRQLMRTLIDEGEARSMDDAAHILADSGEIDSSTHAELLTPAERQRVYGD